MPRKVEVVPHNPNWAREFTAEARNIAAVLDSEVVASYHIGSTAIPKIKAKPTIDILVEVHDIHKIDDYNQAMIGAGYQPKGEHGLPGRRFYTKDNEERRTHNVHIFQTETGEVERHLNFRDYLIAHPEDAQAYSRLKEELAKKFPAGSEEYQDGKDSFIKEIEQRAAVWRAGQDS